MGCFAVVLHRWADSRERSLILRLDSVGAGALSSYVRVFAPDQVHSLAISARKIVGWDGSL